MIPSAYAMWSCFPSQNTLPNRKASLASQPSSDQYRLAEPKRIWPSPSRWIQKPAAAKVSSVTGGLAGECDPGSPQTSSGPAIVIIEARDGDYTLGFDEVRSRPEKKCLLCDIDLRGRTHRTTLSYSELLPLPGGYEALRTYFVLQIVEPKWWERFRARKSYSLPANTLWPTA
ncbi:hypothetical protein BJX62DRAFT_196606 [Aspergillus germanicus]